MAGHLLGVPTAGHVLAVPTAGHLLAVPGVPVCSVAVPRGSSACRQRSPGPCAQSSPCQPLLLSASTPEEAERFLCRETQGSSGYAGAGALGAFQRVSEGGGGGGRYQYPLSCLPLTRPHRLYPSQRQETCEAINVPQPCHWGQRLRVWFNPSCTPVRLPALPRGSGSPALVLLARLGCRCVAPELHYSLSLAHPILPSLCLWVTWLGDFPVPEQRERCRWDSQAAPPCRGLPSPSQMGPVQRGLGSASPHSRHYRFTFPENSREELQMSRGSPGGAQTCRRAKTLGEGAGREGRGCRAAGDAGERSRRGGGSCGAPGERGWKCFHNPQPE